MKIERLKVSHIKRNIIIGVIIVFIISAIVLNFTRARYRVTDSIEIVNGTVNYTPYDFKTLAIYIENNAEEYIYSEEIPVSGYDFNQEKSYCTTNGEIDTSISMTYENGYISINNINKKTKCYFYFDIQEVASNLTEKILNNNGGKDLIETKKVTDFTVIAPSTIKTEDNGFNGGSYSSDASIITYVAYSDSYTFDETTGLYSIVDPEIALYQDIYHDLIGKYVSTIYWSASSPDNIPVNNLEQIYKITDAYDNLVYVQLSTKTLSSNLEDKGMYSAEDDYGMSYYFRGAVDNNWVYFANKYWRIIRINGDGSIRLIYTGDRENITPSNGSIAYYSLATVINNGYSYTFTNFYDQAEYIGYMYQLGLGHGFRYNSAIKDIVDSWYVSNLNNYSNYLSDTGFCNDRTGYSNLTGSQIIEGVGNNSLYFGPMLRIFANYSPTLKCTNKQDNFTVDDIDKGNGALTYPIGMITADEASYAGLVYDKMNSNNYLNVGVGYWTMSPVRSNLDQAYGLKTWMIGVNGTIMDNHSYNPSGGIRPVINLKASVKAVGSGTANDPYIVVSAE